MHLRPFVHSWACWSVNEVCSSTLLARCYFEELKIKVNGAVCFQFNFPFIFFYCYLKSVLVENVPLGGLTMRVHFAYHT